MEDHGLHLGPASPAVLPEAPQLMAITVLWLVVLPASSSTAISIFFFSSRRRHTRYIGDWSSDVCSSDLEKDPDVLVRSRGIAAWTQVLSERRCGVAWRADDLLAGVAVTDALELRRGALDRKSVV